MAEVYVTLGEAAELEGVKYKTMAQRLSRKKETFVTKTEKSETGGKDVVLVAVSSLSKQARNAWKEREKLKSFTESKTTTTKETYTSERWGREGGTTIHQISFTVDISKIKDLPLLYKLIDELKDAQNRTDSPAPATT